MSTSATVASEGGTIYPVSLAYGSLGAISALLLFAVLREIPWFWTDVWGVPVQYRKLLQTWFYPALIAQFALLFSLTWVRLQRSGDPHPSEALWPGEPMVLLWLLYLGVLHCVVVDNVVESLAGLSLGHAFRLAGLG